MMLLLKVLTVVLWLATGINTLFAKHIPKWAYGICWGCLMVFLIINCFK